MHTFSSSIVYIQKMRQSPKAVTRGGGRCHFLAGIILVCLVLTALYLMFRDPIITEHEWIRMRAGHMMQIKNHEWVPIENTEMEHIKHNSPSYTIAFYKIVVRVLLTECSTKKGAALLKSILESDYMSPPFSVDIMIDVRCREPRDEVEAKEREELHGIITSLRWVDGRVTGTTGPPVASLHDYMEQHWMPITNWEITVFLQEGDVLSKYWFSYALSALKEYVVKKEAFVFPMETRVNSKEKGWRLTKIMSDITPHHFLGFALARPDVEEGGTSSNTTIQKRSATSAYTTQRIGSGCIIFPAKWNRLKRSIASQREEIAQRNRASVSNNSTNNSHSNNNSNTTTTTTTSTHPPMPSTLHLMQKALERENLYLIELVPASSEPWFLVCPYDSSSCLPEKSPRKVFPKLSALPHLDVTTNQVDSSKHAFDAVDE